MDQSLVVQGIQECMTKAGVTAKNVVTAVSGRAVIVKKVVMDKMNPDDAKEAIFWEAEQHVPFDIDDVCLDFQVLNEDVGANQMEILLVAAKKEMVNAHAELMRDAGLSPVVIDVDSFAIQNAVESHQRQPARPRGRADQHRFRCDQHQHHPEQHSVLHARPERGQQRLRGGRAARARRDVRRSREHALRERRRSRIRTGSARSIADAANDISMGIERSIAFLKTAGDAERIDHAVLSRRRGVRARSCADILSEKHEMDFTVNDAVAQIDRAEGLFEGVATT